MHLCRRILFALFMLIPVLASAGGMIREDSPTTYMVQPGDTLWDIAGKFLQNPWDWPKVWRANPDIENPHLIYPGDNVSLRYENGTPYLNVAPQHAGSTIKLSPQVRHVPLSDAIPTIPTETMAAFLNNSRVIDKDELKTAAYVASEFGEHLITGRGDSIYVVNLTDQNQSDYIILRPGKEYVHPKTKQVLGYEAKYIGTARLIQGGETAKLQILKSSEEVLQGDKVIPLPEDDLDPYFALNNPSTAIDSYILSVYGGINQIGQYQVVVISGGAEDQLRAGDIFGVYSPATKKVDKIASKKHYFKKEYVTIPAEKSGELIVFKTFPKVSLALIVDANAAIHLHDEVKR